MNPRIQKSHLLAGVALALVLVAAAWAWLGDSSERAPDSRFSTLDGETIELTELRGQPVIIYFWATDCVTCMREMPDLVAMFNELEQRGLQLVAVAMAHDSIEDLQQVRDARDLPFPIVFDADGEFAREFGNVRVTPTKFLIDPQGRIRMRHIGATDHEQLRERIVRML